MEALKLVTTGTSGFLPGAKKWTGVAACVGVLLSAICAFFFVWGIGIYAILVLVLIVPLEFAFLFREKVPPCMTFGNLLGDKLYLSSGLVRGVVYIVLSIPIFFGGIWICFLGALIFMVSGILHIICFYVSPPEPAPNTASSPSVAQQASSLIGGILSSSKQSSKPPPAGSGRV
mmetsp:Transcript_22150/g.36694  ORF Transcript_22150/g.36694 Transcript_22150/m.36694 type:complete len:174 (-) Transcript_22150:499-1020(-)